MLLEFQYILLSLSFRLEIVPSAVLLGTDWLLYCLTLGIHVSGISIYSVIPVLQTRNCSLCGPPWYRSAVVLFDPGHPCFWNFNSVIPVDVVRVKSYVTNTFHNIKPVMLQFQK